MKKFFFALLFCFFSIHAVQAWAMSILNGRGIQTLSNSRRQDFYSDGTFVVPKGVKLIKVELRGAGGGGCYFGLNGNYIAEGANGGDGGGVYAILSVMPGQSIPVTVGVGGSAGSASQDGGAGGDTKLGKILFAGGGGGGHADGTGGTGGDATGTIDSWPGGNGFDVSNGGSGQGGSGYWDGSQATLPANSSDGLPGHVTVWW
jgi:Glycine-rich domain